jgi:ankyrin repeat protein
MGDCVSRPKILSRVNSNDFQYEIYAASATGDIPLIESLIKSVSINYKLSDFGKQTALHVAADRGQMQLCRWLLAQGADPNARDAVGNTPVFNSLKSCHRQVVSLLSDHGADMNVVSNYGRTVEDYISDSARLSRQKILDRLRCCGYLQLGLMRTRTLLQFDDESTEALD